MTGSIDRPGESSDAPSEAGIEHGLPGKAELNAQELPGQSAAGKGMEREGGQHRLWWQLGMLLVVSAIAAYVGISFDENMDRFMPEAGVLTSIFNKKPSGLSGLAEIARRAGIDAHPWQLPYRQLTSVKGMLVIVQPSESLSDFESEQIINWVKKGNDLVYLDHFAFKFTRRLLQQIGLGTKDGKELENQVIKVSADSVPEFQHVNQLVVDSDRRLTGGNSIVRDDDESALMTVVRAGKGRILVGTTPSMFSNRRLSQRENWGNFQFIINWFGTANGDILFDERCHGYSSATNVYQFLLHGATGLVFLQMLLVFLIAVFASKRFGAAKNVRVVRKISSLEFINGLSSAYRRAHANTAVLEIIGQSFRNKLCKALGISPHETREAIMAAWTQRRGRESEMLGRFLEEYERALNERHISDAQLVTLVTSCDKIADESRDLLATGAGNLASKEVPNDMSL